MVDHLPAAIHILIERFTKRQSIVLDAMRDLRPDIVMRTFGEGSPELLRDLTLKFMRKPQTGYWGEGNKWEYYVHGGGCRLTSTKTGECIEWDVIDLKTFDWHWFVNHLEWLLKTDFESDAVKTIRSELKSSEINRSVLKKFVLPILYQLEEAGVITKKQHYYTLISTE
jgi:hypothetical protein